MAKKVISIILVLLFLYSCFPPAIHDKSKLMAQDQIGIFTSPIKTDGYYYVEKIDTVYSYKNIKGNPNAFIIDSTQYRTANVINYIIFNREGYMLMSSSGANFDTPISFPELHLEIQKKLAQKTEGVVRKDEIWFFTKNALVWNNGVFRAVNDKILIQFFYNVQGDYYLKDLKGIVKDSIVTLLFKKNEVLKYKPCRIVNFSNYIQQNPRKFWK